ncbi:MAG: DUF6600 domain-containing protein [Ginsengibacter sp.]
MKKIIYALIFASTILAACSQNKNIGSSYNDRFSNPDEYSNPISYQQFYDNLAPYGEWVNNLEFGRVWIPRESGFRPYYTKGHWAYTNYGWTWVSDYNWGWATFHYGRWFYDNYYGWEWVPGYEWAPAWVSWRKNENYYGWAPSCPRRNNGSYYEIRNDQWAFVPHQFINRNDINNYYINTQNNVTIINNTTIINKSRVINKTSYQEGPNISEVEQVTHTKIRTFAVKETDEPGSSKLDDGTLHIYKPLVKQNFINVDGSKSLPSRNAIPAIKTQRGNENGKSIIGDENANQRTTDRTVNSNQPLKNSNIHPVIKDQNTGDAITNPSPNTNRTFNNLDRKEKQLQDYQKQTNRNIQPNPVNERTDVNGPVPQNRHNNIYNKVPSQRVIENPVQNPQLRTNRERIINNPVQNTSPAVNQRPDKQISNQGAERSPDSYEKRPQVSRKSFP